MNRDDILQHIVTHYESSEDVLLLSDLGEALRNASLWPIEGERRSLAEIIEGLAPDIVMARDPEAKAYVVVVPAGKEELAAAAIDRRHKTRLLRKLPRAVILAFCVEVPPDLAVYLRTEAPIRYAISAEPPDAQSVRVEDQFRLPGLFIDEARHLSPDIAERLASGIQAWAETHGVELEPLFLVEKTSRTEGPDGGQRTPTGSTALERLYSVQPPGVGERMIVPFDIALALSRMP